MNIQRMERNIYGLNYLKCMNIVNPHGIFVPFGYEIIKPKIKID